MRPATSEAFELGDHQGVVGQAVDLGQLVRVADELKSWSRERGSDAWRWLSSAVRVRERPALLLTAAVGNIGFGLEGRSHAVSFLAPAIVAVFSTLQVFAEYQGKNTDLLDRSIELALPVLASAMGLSDEA